MCYSGKCFQIIPIERGSLALALISTGLTGLTLLSSVVSGILILGTIVFFAYNSLFSNHTEFTQAVVEVFRSEVGTFIGIVFAASLVAFVFSALFLSGVYNRRPIYVLMYLCYGVVVALSSAIASIVYMSTKDDHVTGVWAFFASVFYSLCLVMVYQTYVQFRDEAKVRDTIPLVNN